MIYVVKSTNNTNILVDNCVFRYINENNLRLHFSKKSGLKIYDPATQKSKGFGSYFFKYNAGERTHTRAGRIPYNGKYIRCYDYMSSNYKKFKEYRSCLIKDNRTIKIIDNFYQLLYKFLK